MIAPGKVMKGPHSGLAAAGGEEVHDAAVLSNSGDVLEQLNRLFDGERLEMPINYSLNDV
jgi:hypothetical protein